MAATLTEMSDLAANPAFVRKVSAATVKAAIAIGNEAYDGTAYRILRRALATKVLLDVELWAHAFAWAVASNTASISNASSDTDIEWTITTVWDAIAGAYQEGASS